jgi:hypothetical protein
VKKIKRTKIIIRKTEIVSFRMQSTGEAETERCPVCHAPLHAMRNSTVQIDSNNNALRLCEGENLEITENLEEKNKCQN